MKSVEPDRVLVPRSELVHAACVPAQVSDQQRHESAAHKKVVQLVCDGRENQETVVVVARVASHELHRTVLQAHVGSMVLRKDSHVHVGVYTAQAGALICCCVCSAPCETSRFNRRMQIVI